MPFGKKRKGISQGAIRARNAAEAKRRREQRAAAAAAAAVDLAAGSPFSFSAPGSSDEAELHGVRPGGATPPQIHPHPHPHRVDAATPAEALAAEVLLALRPVY